MMGETVAGRAQLARPPGGMGVPELADLGADRRGPLVSRHHRGGSPIRECVWPAVGEAVEPLVTGFLTNAELAAGRAHREALLDDSVNELEALRHGRCN